MNTVLLDTYTYQEAETYAKLNNIDVTEVVRTSVLSFLGKIKRPNGIVAGRKHELPKHLKEMRGILAGVEDKEDERLNYLLNKH